MSTVRGALIDLAGVLYENNEPIPGAVEAVRQMQASDGSIRYLTNTTRQTRDSLLCRLAKLGFNIRIEHLFTAPLAARRLIEKERLRPYLLIHPELEPEFEGIEVAQPNAVVVGDCGDTFTYNRLTEAFRVLQQGGRLISMGSNRYFSSGDVLWLDMGPFAELLRYASLIEPTVVGKPAATFFQEALEDMKLLPDDVVMVGDDIEADIDGAQRLGIDGILVRTGKFRPADERREDIRPTAVLDSIANLTVFILERGVVSC